MSKFQISTLFFDIRRLLVLLLLLIVVGGMSSFLTMPNEEDPRITNRVATIFTPYPGASAERVEQVVTERIENAMRELDEVDELRSVSTNGLSAVTVVLRDDIMEPDVPFGMVRDAMDDAKGSLPPGVLPPHFDDTRAGAYTFMAAITWTADATPSPVIMRRSALELQDRLRAIPGTELVTVEGVAAEEITVVIDPAQLTALRLSRKDIASAINRTDAKVSAGSLNGDRYELGIEVSGEIDGLARLGDVVLLGDSEGRVVRLRDVAEIKRGLEQPEDRLALHNGERAVVIASRMQPDRRVVDWSRAAQNVIDEFRLELSGGLALHTVFNQGTYTSKRFASLVDNLLVGACLVVVVLLLTLGLRAALIVAAAIPLTGLVSLIGLNTFGVTINQISVTGLVVALGLLVDSAIVITDAVRRALVNGMQARDAVRASVTRLWVPLLSSTVTTVLAFTPLVLLPGGAGEFVGGIGKSVILSLTASLFLALTAIATLAGIFLPASFSPESEPVKGWRRYATWWKSGLRFRRIGAGFDRLLRASLSAPLLSISCACVLPVLGFIGVGSLPTSFFPVADRNQFHIEMRLPTQATLSETKEIVDLAQAYLGVKEGITSTTWFVGQSAPNFYYNLVMNQDGNANYAQAMVTTSSLRGLPSLIEAISQDLGTLLPDAQVIARQLSQGPPTFAPIELRIYGPNLQILNRLGEQARLVFSHVPDVMETFPSYAGGEPKLRVTVNESRARQAGYALGDIATALQVDFDGVVAGSIIEGSESLPIRVRNGIGGSSVSQLNDFALPALIGDADSVPLSALGSAAIEPSASALRRFRGQRVNIVSGYMRPDTLPAEAIAEFKTNWTSAGYTLPPGYRFEFGGDEEARSDNVGALASKVGVISILILSTIVLTFNSFRLAAVVFMVGILSIGLGMLSLAVFRFPFGFQPIVGLIGLTGVAINASIIILSGLQGSVQAKCGDLRAIGDEVLSTSRHIWSTTITTFGGFLPLILSEGGFWPPFATAIAGGVLLSTVISFFFVPQAFIFLTRLTGTPALEYPERQTHMAGN